MPGLFEYAIEPPRGFRRLQLLGRAKHHVQNHARAVWMVLGRECLTKIDRCANTLNDRAHKAEVDSRGRAGILGDMRERMTPLERENRNLRQAGEVLHETSAYFAMISGNAARLQHCRRCAPPVDVMNRNAAPFSNGIASEALGLIGARNHAVGRDAGGGLPHISTALIDGMSRPIDANSHVPHVKRTPLATAEELDDLWDGD